MTSSLVTIIIPTYNRYFLLGEALDSIVNQTYANWECIVVDDGSKDYTNELMNFYCSLPYKIKFHKRPKAYKKGANSCRNYGFELSQGDFIMWLDDDDYLDPFKLQKQIEIANPEQNHLITCAWGRLVGRNSDIKKYSIYKDYKDPTDLLTDYGTLEYFPSHAFLLSRKLVEQIGTWNEDLTINQDGVFFAKAIVNASEIKFAKDTFVLYRNHTANNTSMISSKTKAKDLIKSWKMIEEIISENGGTKGRKYILNARKHTYNLLKVAGYRKIIARHPIIFRRNIFKDVRRKIKEVINT